MLLTARQRSTRVTSTILEWERILNLDPWHFACWTNLDMEAFLDGCVCNCIKYLICWSIQSFNDFQTSLSNNLKHMTETQGILRLNFKIWFQYLISSFNFNIYQNCNNPEFLSNNELRNQQYQDPYSNTTRVNSFNYLKTPSNMLIKILGILIHSFPYCPPPPSPNQKWLKI